MSYAAQPLTQMWRGFAADEMFGDFSLVRDTVERLDEQPFSRALQAALHRAVQTDGLTVADHALLQEFAAGCGVTGMDEQRRHLEAYARLCRQQSDEAAQQASVRAPVYRMMGVAGGVAVAMLFL